MHRPNVEKHLAFGHGVHKCLGSRIAKMQLRLAFERIFERFPNIHWTGKQTISPNALVHAIPVYEVESLRTKRQASGSSPSSLIEKASYVASKTGVAHLFFHGSGATLSIRLPVSGQPKWHAKTLKCRFELDSQCPLCAKIALMKRLDWFNRVEFIDIYATSDCPLEPSRLSPASITQKSVSPSLRAQRLLPFCGVPTLLKPVGMLARIPLMLRLLERGAMFNFCECDPLCSDIFSA